MKILKEELQKQTAIAHIVRESRAPVIHQPPSHHSAISARNPTRRQRIVLYSDTKMWLVKRKLLHAFGQALSRIPWFRQKTGHSCRNIRKIAMPIVILFVGKIGISIQTRRILGQVGWNEHSVE